MFTELSKRKCNMQNVNIRAVRAAGAIVGLAACSGIALAGTLTGMHVGSPSNPGSLTVNGNQMTQNRIATEFRSYE
jgi:hypothetical protein